MIENIFSSAELALAAYSDLNDGSLIPQESALVQDGKGLSQIQASNFASQYTVVTQYNDTDTSFSATVFKDSEGNLTTKIYSHNMEQRKAA